MPTPEEIKEALVELDQEGLYLFLAEVYRKRPNEAIGGGFDEKTLKGLAKKYPLNQSYQKWYSKCLPLLRQIAPERLDEFVELYKVEKRREINVTTYGISDYLQGVSTTSYGKAENYIGTFISKIQIQLGIIESITEIINNKLSDLVGLLQVEIFNSEIDAAEELNKKKHHRAAGTLAGVVLETHLKTVCRNHKIKLAKRNPALSDYNDALKNDGIVDLRVGDLFNILGIYRICAHIPKIDNHRTMMSMT